MPLIFVKSAENRLHGFPRSRKTTPTASVGMRPIKMLGVFRHAPDTAMKAESFGLVSSKAEPFNPLRQLYVCPRCRHASQSFGYRQSIAACRVFNGAHIPKRLRSVLRKGATVEGREVFLRGRIVHCIPLTIG
jgi:hypothetical protein